MSHIRVNLQGGTPPDYSTVVSSRPQGKLYSRESYSIDHPKFMFQLSGIHDRGAEEISLRGYYQLSYKDYLRCLFRTNSGRPKPSTWPLPEPGSEDAEMGRSSSQEQGAKAAPQLLLLLYLNMSMATLFITQATILCI